MIVRLVPGLVVAAILVCSSFWPGPRGEPSGGVSQVSAVAAPASPTATYVSELGPAVVMPPHSDEILPVAGSTSVVEEQWWPKLGGALLAFAGIVFISLAFRLRLEGRRDEERG